MALRQAGYCGKCEFMPREEARYRLMVHDPTLNRMAARGELKKVRVMTRVLYHRADVEATRERMRLKGKGWFGIVEPSPSWGA